jgi:exodeoxyribonuclease VII large subunit
MPDLLSPAEGSPSRPVFSVGELNEVLRTLIEDSLPSLWVQGEISNLSKPASGHWYFTLKDARAQIRCAMFKNANYAIRPAPKEGDLVLLRGRAGIYPARGELQMIAEYLEPAGTGALLRAFEQLKARLAAEGVFDADTKRPIPGVPRRIGLITSGSGAALHDVLTTLRSRWPLAEVLLMPVPVQGKEAPPAIVRALAELPKRAAVDVILLCRGGGSLEDLWSFNEEIVARAIRACAVPVICGVGHETDVTIADFAADLRAATPTAAAMLATPDGAEWLARCQRLNERLNTTVQQRLHAHVHQLDALQARLHRLHPGRSLLDRVQRLDELDERLNRAGRLMVISRQRQAQIAAERLQRVSPATLLSNLHHRVGALATMLKLRITHQIEVDRGQLAAITGLLATLDPKSILQRGYAIARSTDGRVLRSATEIRPGERVDLTLAEGLITTQVIATK